MKQNRVDRIMAALKEMGLHQMLIVDPMSIYYLTGVYVSPFERFYGLYLREDGHHAFFLNRLFTIRAIIDAIDGINDHSRKINTIIGCEILHIGVIKRFGNNWPDDARSHGNTLPKN